MTSPYSKLAGCLPPACRLDFPGRLARRARNGECHRADWPTPSSLLERRRPRSETDIADLKGALEEFLDQFGLRGMTYTRRADSTALFLELATVQLGKFRLANLANCCRRSPALRFEGCRVPGRTESRLPAGPPEHCQIFQAVAGFPSIRRDVAMMVPEATTHEAVFQVVKQAKPANLEAVNSSTCSGGRTFRRAKKHGLRLHLP